MKQPAVRAGESTVHEQHGVRDPRHHTVSSRTLDNAAHPSMPGRIRSASRLEQKPGPPFCLVDPNLYQTGARNVPVFIAHIVSFA